MRHQLSLLIATVCLTISVGCGSSDPTSLQAAKEVTTEFLEGLRTADSETINRLLTPLAQEKIAECEMIFAPPGSDTASYTIERIQEFRPEEVAVETIWSDLDADGKRASDKMTWALKLVDGQWRVYGMAVDEGPNKKEIVFDFEDPTEMLRAQNRSTTVPGNSAPRQANQPTQDPFRTGTR
jgi:hypothetical protein